jgi:radical SAM protein with 4Fe4S-binding SPASM domain
VIEVGRTRPTRFLTQADRSAPRPVHAVWEITLACDLKCTHCGSRAGAKRPAELSTAECLDVVAQLARLGTREVTLIGGEAYLRRDFAEIIAAVTAAGMVCTMQSGGRNLTDARIEAAVAAGLKAAGISIDGMRELHDELRGVPGSFDAAIASLARLRAHGVTSSVNTQIGEAVIDQLDDVLDVVIAAGAKNWQLQLTVPMGRAADRPELIVQPYRLAELFPLLATLYARAARNGVLLQVGNNLGYFGPYEGLLRGNGLSSAHYGGCVAGTGGIGIEADGKVKGCPSLPTDGYTGGNVRDIDLTSIWLDTPELTFARERRTTPTGFCDSCYYKPVCNGGCTWIGHSLLGKPGDNPFCHHRVLELRRQGLRESIRHVGDAPGTAFDHGLFAVDVQTLDGAAADRPALDETPRDARAGATLQTCYGCSRHVFAGTEVCPFCATVIDDARRSYAGALADARRAAAALVDALSAPG